MVNLNFNKKNSKSAEYRAQEWIKCRQNPLYFIYNYVFIPETGSILKISDINLHLKMKRIIKIIYRYHKAILMASRQLGKALSIDTPIPIANGGYKYMKDITTNDCVLDGNGNPTKVVATTDIMYNHDCFEIKFDNGETIVADADHLWKVSNTTKKFKNKIKTTRELYNIEQQIRKWKNPTGCKINLSNNVNYLDIINLPIPPYLLGLWLGDGSSNAGNISCHKDDYLKYCSLFEDINFKVSSLRYQKDYDLCSTSGLKECGTFTVYTLITLLKQNNLLNNKHIPFNYLKSSINNRLELLRGLMDSDGYCNKICGMCQFYQKDYNLLSQVRQLLASLGIKSKYTYRSIKNEKYHTLSFTTNKYRVFNLERKYKYQEGSGKRQENYNVYIKSIKPIKSVPVKCIQVENQDGMYLCGYSMIPTHNSTLASMLIAWAMVFYPRNRAIILNFQQKAGLQNLQTIKFIIENLPDWMVTKKRFKSKSELKTYFELFNDSRVDVFYPSTIHSSDTLARSLTSPILYIDEAAFIKDMAEIYGSAQPVLSKAKEQAIKNDYPFFNLITSTPNGSSGRGEWFYKRWNRSVNSDNLFIADPIDKSLELWNDKIDIDSEVVRPDRNTFVRVKYHWSEDPTKNKEWYIEQCQELDDERKINQELDLIFVGASDCIFTDKMLSSFVPADKTKQLITRNGASLEIFGDIDPTDWYIIGCDTAESLTGAFCAIQIFGFKDFTQIAELQNRYGQYHAFASDIDFVFQWLYKLVGDRIILSVENNTINN